MIRRAVNLARRAVRNPEVAVERVRSAAVSVVERATSRAGALSERKLLRLLDTDDIDALWKKLAERPFATVIERNHGADLDARCPGASQRVRERAVLSERRVVQLLGSGPVRLGDPIDWHTDFKSGITFDPRFFRDYEYSDLDRPSDVKVPWELSRLQWLLPVGQAYLLDGGEGHARFARTVLEEWMEANPYARSVNWACTMEVALRVLSWTWLFHVFHGSSSWADRGFRSRFLRVLYSHGRFTARHLEISPVAGNHYTADAAGLVFAGHFFGDAPECDRWQAEGWRILSEEIGRQTLPDGVNHEASVPYHRLNLELFLLPALFRLRAGDPIDSSYKGHLRRMAEFSRQYCGPDGSSPYQGDADDARALPFGTQALDDHRYLAPLVEGVLDGVATLVPGESMPEELAWALGVDMSIRCDESRAVRVSRAFPDGGIFILQSGGHQAFIDCGPVGLRGRGGHGHNDCLSFELVLDGVRLVRDCGSFVYTASWKERNAFRSTRYHNTPSVDDAEINRFTGERDLWTLIPDALPRLLRFDSSAEADIFVGSHSGFERLPIPVTPRRAVVLHRREGWIVIEDCFEGLGEHDIEVPLHLAPGVTAEVSSKTGIELVASGRRFWLGWEGEAWKLVNETGRVSPSYGLATPCTRLAWRRSGSIPARLTVAITTGETPRPDVFTIAATLASAPT